METHLIKTKIIYASERDDGFDKIDVYIDLGEEGKWILVKDQKSDSNLQEEFPKLSKDGKYLFYSPKRNGKGSMCIIDVQPVATSIKRNLNIP